MERSQWSLWACTPFSPNTERKIRLHQTLVVFAWRRAMVYGQNTCSRAHIDSASIALEDYTRPNPVLFAEQQGTNVSKSDWKDERLRIQPKVICSRQIWLHIRMNKPPPPLRMRKSLHCYLLFVESFYIVCIQKKQFYNTIYCTLHYNGLD